MFAIPAGIVTQLHTEDANIYTSPNSGNRCRCKPLRDPTWDIAGIRGYDRVTARFTKGANYRLAGRMNHIKRLHLNGTYICDYESSGNDLEVVKAVTNDGRGQHWFGFLGPGVCCT